MRRKNAAGRGAIVSLILAVLLILCVTVGVLVLRRVEREGEKALYPMAYAEIVTENADAYGIPRELVFAVIRCESSFDPMAESKAGAQGLMQLTPDTYDWVAWRLGEEAIDGGVFEPEINVRYGCYYLSYLYGLFSDWELVLAAYNAGPGNVEKWLADTALSDGEELVSIPFAETRAYVPKVMAVWEEYERIWGKTMENGSSSG